MIKIIKYSNRVIKLRPYTTKHERDILIYTSDTYSIDTILELLQDCIDSNISLDKLSYNEKFNILLNLKNISVGETFTFRCTCSECNKKYEEDFNFLDTVKNSGKIPDFNKIKITESFSDDYNDYVDFDIDELDVEEYDKLIEHIKKYKLQFNFKSDTTCPYCGNIASIELVEEDLVKGLSDDDLANFYKVISGMIYFGHFSLQDINQMIPFERSIYLGLLNKMKEDTTNTIPGFK